MLRTIAFLLVCFVAIQATFAQSTHHKSNEQQENPDPVEVIERFVTALGGEMSLHSIETLHVHMESGGIVPGSVDYFYKNGKRLTEATYNEARSRQMWDGKTWTDSIPLDDSNGRPTTPQERLLINETPFDIPTDALQLLKQAREREFEIVDPKEYASSAFVHCVCITHSDKSAGQIRRYFDPETDLLICVERYGATEPEYLSSFLAVRFCDLEYEEFEEISFLKSSNCQIGPSTRPAKYSGYKINEPIEDSVFVIKTGDDE